MPPGDAQQLPRPHTLADLVASIQGDVRAGTVARAAGFGQTVAVAIPLRAIWDLPPEPFAGKRVIDANSYFPQRDGHIPQLDTPLDHLVGAAGLPAARRHRGEGLHMVFFQRLLDDSHPDLPAAQRLAIPVAGDDEDARRTVIELIDQIGFTGVDAGTLAGRTAPAAQPPLQHGRTARSASGAGRPAWGRP
jgi:8-hydroxy-5-deazaflavin:NADPH oxidoreductase